MNAKAARDRRRGFFGGLHGDQGQRAKLIGACILVGVAVLWFGYSIAPYLKSPRRAQDPTGPGWDLARELNEALLQRPEFADTAFQPESDDPIKLRLVGAVHSPRDLEALQAYVRSLKPDAPPDQFEFDVEILK